MGEGKKGGRWSGVEIMLGESMGGETCVLMVPTSSSVVALQLGGETEGRTLMEVQA